MRLLVLFCALAASALAQSLISAKSGLIHYAEGDVLLAGKPVELKTSVFQTMKTGETLATEEGRAEVLLGPGVFLRMSDHTQVKMINGEITDSRIELKDGTIIIEAADSVKTNRTLVLVGGQEIAINKDGVYSITAGPQASVRVWSGELAVGSALLKGGRVMMLADGKVEKFDKEQTDSLYRWASRRASYVAMANMSAARTVQLDSPRGWTTGGWYYNTFFNMFTYLPGQGAWNSPFGYRYWSPGAVLAVYQPVFSGGGSGGGPSFGGPGAGGWQSSYNPNLGYSTIGGRTGGGVNGGISVPSAPVGGGVSGGAAGGGAAAGGSMGGGRSGGGGATHSGASGGGNN
ncbi:MAG: hypothetical protein NTV70_25295 [Acidobacteria bacterium]|nr:hypothetical protein [Acidobacteriota bacterium]